MQVGEIGEAAWRRRCCYRRAAEAQSAGDPKPAYQPKNRVGQGGNRPEGEREMTVLAALFSFEKSCPF
jgi:hypothetical protein